MFEQNSNDKEEVNSTGKRKSQIASDSDEPVSPAKRSIKVVSLLVMGVLLTNHLVIGIVNFMSSLILSNIIPTAKEVF